MNRQRPSPRIGPGKMNARVGARHLRSPLLPIAARHSIGRVGPRVGTYSWDPNDGFIPPPEPVSDPRLTVRCEYPGAPLEPIDVTFSLSPSYGIRTAGDAHGWFRRMMREHEEFEVETDRAGEPPLSFWSKTVRRVVVE